MFGRYVGLPWIDRGRTLNGLDCWGLIYLINLNERGLELPCYADRYATAADRRALDRLIGNEIDDWDEIAAGQEQLWDCILMRDGRTETHIGLVVAPGRMLHVAQGKTSVIENYRSGVWRHRVVGFFRYRR